MASTICRRRPALKEICSVILNRDDEGEAHKLTDIATNWEVNTCTVDSISCSELVRMDDQRQTDDQRLIVTSMLRRRKGKQKDTTGHATMVTSTPAPKITTTNLAAAGAAETKINWPQGQDLAERRSSRGRLEFPVSPIADRSHVTTSCPTDDAGSLSSPPTGDTEPEHRGKRRIFDESSPDHADFSCGRFDRSRSRRSYSRTPRQSTGWALINDDDVECNENAKDEDDQSETTVVKAVLDDVDPFGFLVLCGPLPPSLSTSTSAGRGRRRCDVTFSKRSPLEGGCYSPPTVIKRKRPQKKKPQQPVWDEARYSHVFDEMNREFDEIENTELCVVFEDESKGGHGHGDVRF